MLHDGPEPLGEPITQVVIDSRQSAPGALFVALKGERTDGHLYVEDALRRGARVALIERDVTLGAELGARLLDTRSLVRMEAFVAARGPLCVRVADTLAALQKMARYWRELHALRVIGVTGSVGKTTTKEVIADVLAQRYKVLRSAGNFNNEIGLPLTLLRLDESHQRAVLEMGMYDVGDIALLASIAHPQVGVVTNVQPVHLERAKSIERIAQAKFELPAALPAAPDGCAVLNYDDARVRAMGARVKARTLTFGREPGADLRAEDIAGHGLEGVEFTLRHGDTARHVQLPLPGEHNVYTALAAAAVGLAEGLDWDEIVRGLETRGDEPVRMVVRRGPGGCTLLDDTYNASPLSVNAALRLLGELEGRRVAVLGDMFELGSYEEEGHRLVGRTASEVAQLLVAVGERARWIAEEARVSGLAEEDVLTAPDAPAAVPLLRERLRAGDVVLVKGSRGMAMEAIVRGLAEEEGTA